MSTFYLINTKTEKVIAEGSKSAMRKQRKGMKAKESKNVKISKIHPTKGSEKKASDKKWTPEQVEATQRSVDLIKWIKAIDSKLALILEKLEQDETEDEDEEEEDDDVIEAKEKKGKEEEDEEDEETEEDEDDEEEETEDDEEEEEDDEEEEEDDEEDDEK